MKKATFWGAGLLVLALAAPARGDVKLPSIFTDNAVFQSGQPVRVWGWADPGEEVTVTTNTSSFADKLTQVADKEGRWEVKLDSFGSGEKLTLVVEGKNRLEVKNILVGEVWLCSGQSNMAWTVARSDNFEQEKANANHPEIRMFKVNYRPATKPQQDVPGQWIVCSPETVGLFSGTAYFFGLEIHQNMKVPVGLINSSVGGTAVEAWTSMDAQKNVKKLAPIFASWDKLAKGYNAEKAQASYEKRLAQWKKAVAKARAEKKKPPRKPKVPVDPRADRNHPSNLFNGMIAPLIPYTIRGAIWYQGERNSNGQIAHLYGKQLPVLIRDWRERWNQGEFPFLWVQLPNFKKRVSDPVQESGWALVREGMLQSLRVPNTGMAVTIDIGDPDDIHPSNKQDFGKRLARVALARVYEKDLTETGPLYKGYKVTKNKFVISFNHTNGGLQAKGSNVLKGFAIAGKEGVWKHAQAKIEQDTVIVWNPEIRNPVAVRYAWADNPECNLYNGAGLPASPFRTDGK